MQKTASFIPLLSFCILHSAFCIVPSALCAAAPVYDPKDIDVSSNAVTCRVAGTPLLDGDAFSNADFWTLTNYENRLGIEVGGERDGVKGLCIDGSAKVCDSAWCATSGRIRLKGAGRRYRLGFSIDTSVSIKLPNRDGEAWRSQIDWFGADGGKISTELLAYTVPRGRRTLVAIAGDIPGGAASCTLRFAFDVPNIGPANRVVYSGLSFEELADAPSHAAAAEFLSEIHSGGKVSWVADVPDGCAILFQWRGASSPEELARKSFVGPDGTDGSFFTAPFAADAPLIQYRALLRSDGKATPSLREVSGGRDDARPSQLTGGRDDARPSQLAGGRDDARPSQLAGGRDDARPSQLSNCQTVKLSNCCDDASAVAGRWTDRDWTLDVDNHAPQVRRISPSPTRNVREPLRIEVKAGQSPVHWDTLKVTVDGADRTADVSRENGVISLAAPEGGWTQGLHSAEVQVVDIHANRAKRLKMFYVGEAPKTPKVSLRDDGMTLIDGKPFFPIGMYAVCKRSFNGNDFDVAFKGLKEAGFNTTHTYGNTYAEDFLAAAAKYDMKLWVEARFPDSRLIDVGRHHPSIIAWYLGDDTADHILPEQEADFDEAVKAVDPTRISVQADPILSSGGGFSRYAEYVTATDGLMPEIYPVRNEEGDPTDTTCVAVTIRDMKQFAEDVRLHRDGKPRTCWAILQYFKGWGGWKHFPTREQLFATSFAAIIHGAHGITWYTYGGFYENEGVTSTPERWRNICDLATRLSELSPVLVERTPPQPPVPTVMHGPKTDPLGGPSVTCLLKRHDGWNYLLAVNAAAEPVTVRLTAEGAETVEVLHEDRSCPASDGGVTDDFAPFDVHIYRWRTPTQPNH